MSDELKQAALEYHATPRPGKISVEITKPTVTSRDLSLAYSPGVAEPVRSLLLIEIDFRFIWLSKRISAITAKIALLVCGIFSTCFSRCSRRLPLQSTISS